MNVTRNCVLLRVGIDAGCGGIQGPLLEDGSFDFVCIPDNKGVSVHTYGNMLSRDGKPLAGYFAQARRKVMAEQHVHVDPEWETFTYGDPTPPKRSLRNLKPGDLLVFYCGLQEWHSESGWNPQRRPALFLAGYFEVALAGMAGDFEDRVLATEFGNNFHVRYPTVFKQQKDDLVLVKGGAGSRLFRKAHQISSEGKDRAGKPLKVLSPTMRKLFGDFGGQVSIQRSPPRWVDKASTWPLAASSTVTPAIPPKTSGPMSAMNLPFGLRNTPNRPVRASNVARSSPVVVSQSFTSLRAGARVRVSPTSAWPGQLGVAG
jgi:hypothetical protein